MLMTDKGSVQFRGNKLTLMVEFTVLIHEMIESSSFTIEDIDLCVETAKKSYAQIHEEIKRKMDIFGKSILDLL